MSEPQVRYEVAAGLWVIDVVGDNRRPIAHCSTPEDAECIVATLNDAGPLLEQVRLYELAAERGWIIRPITCNGEIVEWCTAERGEFIDRLLGTGPTPKAAIAAAEKKEQSHG